MGTSTKNESKYAKEAEEAKKAGKWVPDACTARFDINSFVYRARKPFHPKRLIENWLMPYFADPIEAIEKEEEIKDVTEEEKEQLKDLISKLDEEKEEDMKKSQAEALEKQKLRNETMGELLRSKGFLWLATSNDIIGGWQHAGNVLRIKGERNWLCLTPELWEGTEVASEVLKDIQKDNGEDWEYKDRRQEIVFIGHGMKIEVIRKLLDDCLLTDEEMELGPRMWKKTMEEFDKYKFVLEDSDDNMDSEDSEDDDDDDDDELETEKVERMGMNDSDLMKGKKRMITTQGGRPSKI